MGLNSELETPDPAVRAVVLGLCGVYIVGGLVPLARIY